MAIMRADAGSIQMREAEENTLRLLVWQGFHSDAAAFWQRVDLDSSSSCGEVLRTEQRVVVSDIETCEFMAGTPHLEAYRRSGLRAVQATPLVSRSGHLLGVLSTHWHQPYEPPERALRLLDVLARQAADLIERAQTEAILQQANTGLEARVAERTEALEQAHDQLQSEMTERQQMQEALFQREKLAALGMLLANVAHELNNPLSVATMEVDNLTEARSDEAQAEELETLRQAIERCNRVVQSFLALARQQPIARSAVALNALVDDVLVLLRHTLEADGIDLELHLEGDLPLLDVDANQLHHVIANLITNAQHALRQSEPPRHLTLTTAVSEAATEVTLEVADNGPGIPLELQQRVFEPFFTTRSENGGSGLGLSLCQSVIEAHGGTLSLASQVGQGTTVRLSLPIAPPANVQAPAPPEVVAASEPPRRGRILLIDDEATVRRALQRLLERSGHELALASNGLEGLAALQGGAYDVILCDIRMPDLDGPGFYREVVRVYPHLVSRLVFLTGDVLSPEIQAFFDQVGGRRLVKPFQAREVRRLIQQVLEAP
jgi:signal transduction histidine kinase/CheY-like chemotaxis protein